MLAIIFIESHDGKHCFGPDLALRIGAQKLCKRNIFYLEGALLCLRKGALWALKEVLRTKKWGVIAPQALRFLCPALHAKSLVSIQE